ncbi:MAG: 50S ribosomal protein L10 [Devosiaceae bacterium]|nr:50S ribosomal protein L10 [Devosiaceae bacterium]
MDRAQKAEFITSFRDSVKDAGAIVVAHYAGLSVSEMENLRVQMKQAGGHVKVAKNRLAKLALEQTENADMSDLLTGQVVFAYSSDPVAAPKVAVKFAKDNENFVVLGGAMGAVGLDADGVKALASVPSLDELRATIAGMLVRPATKIAVVLQAPGSQVARVVGAYADKDAAA